MASTADYQVSLYIDIYRILREVETRSLLEIMGLLLSNKTKLFRPATLTKFKNLNIVFSIISSGKYLYKE